MIELKYRKKLNFSSSTAFLEVDQKILKQEFLILYGKSGSGKTSFLKILAGLMDPDEGKIISEGKSWFDKNQNIKVSPQKRNIGFVFQDYALFPNMSVKQNVEFAHDTKDSVFLNEVFEVCGIKGLLNRKPDTLSGGQKQRTALARAIVKKPSILILDEPLSALDQETRLSLQDELVRIHKKFELTTIMVSHDLSEIAKLGHRVLVLDEGKIKEEGDPITVFSKGKVSGKVKFVGEIIHIKKEDIIFVLTIASGNNIVKVVATEEDIKSLGVGDKVMVASKAFNPIIVKI
ncbi:MAG TPA: ATP-binding cassette domain-containing protein [Cytophagales bacterium]|nr:ATP-binding cassette domain-containing protein [Cytophagales bacterium]